MHPNRDTDICTSWSISQWWETYSQLDMFVKHFACNYYSLKWKLGHFQQEGTWLEQNSFCPQRKEKAKS